MKKTLALLLALVMCISLLAGCAKEPEAPSDPTPAPAPAPAPTPTPDPKPSDPTPAPTPTPDPPKPAEPKVLKDIRTAEDTTMNVYLTPNVADMNTMYLTVGRLWTYFPKADGSGIEMLPEYAEGEPTSPDGKTWTIKLNKNGQWPDGKKITADDWVFSWKAALDPVMMYAQGSSVARGSNTGVDIVNAFDYWNQTVSGTPVKWEDVGIKKVDDYTVEVKLTAEVSALEFKRHFQARYASVIRQDLYEKCLSADGKSTTYGTSVDTVMFCGPYLLKEWTKATEYTLVKNTTWVMADYIKIDEIYSRVVLDEGTRLEMFESGECDFMDLGTNGMAKYEEDPRTKSYSNNCIRCIEFNMNHSDPVKKALFCNADFRKAIYYATDRTAIAKLTDTTASPGRVTGLALLSDGTAYRSTAEAKSLIPANNGYDPKLANEYLDKAFKAVGITSADIQITYQESTGGCRQASEYMQADFQKVFGDKLKVNLQANTGLPALMRSSKETPNDDWELCWSSWSNSTESWYPCVTMSLYRSDYGSKYTLYNNTELDAVYALYISDEYRLDAVKRDSLVYKMEKAYMDHMSAVPVFQVTNFTIFSDRVEPALDTYVGYVYWGVAWGDIKQ